MKKIVCLLFVTLLLIGSQVFAGETFTLTAPVTVEPQAYGGEITSYQIVPGSSGRLMIHFRWKVIRTQDVGLTVGVALRTLIHAKIETKFGVTID
jgi:hypothetical protein